MLIKGDSTERLINIHFFNFFFLNQYLGSHVTNAKRKGLLCELWLYPLSIIYLFR